MATIDENKVQQLIEDVESIKSVIASNKPLIKQLLLPVHFRIIALIAGLAFIAVAALYYLLLEYYGAYQSIPSHLRTFAIAFAVACYVVVVVLKRVLWMRSVRKMDPQITFGKLVKNLYRTQLIHVWIPSFLLIIFLMIYLIYKDAFEYIVPLASIGMGVIYNSIGSVTRIKQYIMTGYWLIGTGILPLLFPEVSALIYLGFCLGGGMLLFAGIGGMKDSTINEG